MGLALTFYTTPNKGMRPGRELVVFKKELASSMAGNRVTPGNSYGEALPKEYHDGYQAWFLNNSDHSVVFERLANYFSPDDLRQKAHDIEQGILVDDKWRIEDLMLLAEEIEKARERSREEIYEEDDPDYDEEES